MAVLPRRCRSIPTRMSKMVIIRAVSVTVIVVIIADTIYNASTVGARKDLFKMSLDVTVAMPGTTPEISTPVPTRGLPTSPPKTDPTQKYGSEMSIDKEKALLAGRVRKEKGHLTLGIPTVRRDKGDYLIETIQSLISNMDANEREETTIVVFLADFDESLRNLTLQELKREFQGYMNIGLLRVIAAPREFYPSLDGLKRTYHHPEKQVKWRSKQNYDYAFLFKYSGDIAEYYMQLEDDIVTTKKYLQITKDFIASQKTNWVCLELSELGYIGKLYHSSDLEQLAKMMMLFFQEQPPDVTFIYFNILLMQFQRIIRIPTIFQHMGYHSSLSGKVQPLKDKYFDDTSKQYNGDNPPASIFTNFTTYEPYKAHFAYAKSYGYFWAKDPTIHSYFLLVFDRPERVRRIVVTTGSNSHQTDILVHGILEISPTLITKTETSAECANYVYAGNVTSDGKIDVEKVAELMHFDVFCVRVTMTAAQTPWIVFREIAIFVEPR